jgi:hypothetical protein
MSETLERHRLVRSVFEQVRDNSSPRLQRRGL